MKRIIFLIAVLILVPSSLFALSLDEAKDQGLVGETASGYLEAVTPTPSAEVKALMGEINSKRKLEYQRISQETKSPLMSVEQLAAVKAIKMTKPGRMVKDSTGSWIKK